MNEAGVSAPDSPHPRRRRDGSTAAASEPSPAGVASTISPLSTHGGGSSVLTAAASFEKYRVIGRWFRLPISPSSPYRKSTGSHSTGVGGGMDRWNGQYSRLAT